MRSIKILHLESTDVCQAACPLCARETDKDFSKNTPHHLTIDKIFSVLSVDQIKQLDKMFMCGNYGDPAAGAHTVSIYQAFRKINKDIVLGMNTNGGLQNHSWWANLARILNGPKDYVVFSIDGLADTNHIYRKNVDWTRLMNNIESFIQNGGKAHWDMLVYGHNQHQVSQCQEMAKRLGFTWFRAKVSKRALVHGLSYPNGWKNPKIHSQDIECHALNEQSLYIDAQGRVSPCCWLGSTQNHFVDDFDTVQKTWKSNKPNAICVATCGSRDSQTSFTNQWQLTVEFSQKCATSHA